MTAPLGQAARAAARADVSAEAEIEGRTWFLEVHNPPLELVLVGAVHIAQPLAAMAALAGYARAGDRPPRRLRHRGPFSRRDAVQDWPDEALAKAPLGSRSALWWCWRTIPRSTIRRWKRRSASRRLLYRRAGFQEDPCGAAGAASGAGLSAEALARIQGPVGLAIGARSPAEIALSILAQMTQTLRC